MATSRLMSLFVAVSCTSILVILIGINTYSDSYRFAYPSHNATSGLQGVLQNVTWANNVTTVTTASQNRQHQETDVRLLRGHVRDKNGFLTIGLCTVPREGVSYLVETLDSLITKMRPADMQDVVIVVYLGSLNITWVDLTSAELNVSFSSAIDTGLLQIVQPLASIYPNFSSITKRTFDDTESRVYWRTKQNIDYAYLFSYAADLSEYYLHVEDDIIAAQFYVDDVRQHIQKYSNKFWFCIDFSTLGFIGKLFHSSDLVSMKEYFLLFKAEQPGDWLLRKLSDIMTQPKPIKSVKSIFQHQGKISSLTNKIQNATDKRFKGTERLSIPIFRFFQTQNMFGN